MTFRTRLLLIFAVAVAAAVGMVELIVSSRARESFENMEAHRVNAIVAQFDKEFQRRGEEIVRTVEGIADSAAAREIAITPDPATYSYEAGSLASTNRLDLLELVAGDGAIVSSAQWQARFGYKEDWLASEPDWQSRPAFLKREELPDSVALALVAVRTVAVGGMKLYVAGGRVLDTEFIASLVPPQGMRVLLYRNLAPAFSPADLIDAHGPVASATALRSLVMQVEQQRREAFGTIGRGAAAETFHALPLKGTENDVLGVLLIGNSRRELVELEASMLRTAVVVAVTGILMAIVLGWWATARITRPVQRLAESAGKSGRGQLGRHRGSGQQGRDRATGARLQSHDARAGGAARAPGAGRARGGVARTGAAAGARVEESAVPAADHGGEHAARARQATPSSSTRCFAKGRRRCSRSSRI